MGKIAEKRRYTLLLVPKNKKNWKLKEVTNIKSDFKSIKNEE